jgi:hypothetical protein
MPAQVPIANAPKMQDVDLESADTRSESLPEAYAVKTGTEPDEPIQAQPVHGGPQPGDRIRGVSNWVVPSAMGFVSVLLCACGEHS